MTFLKCYYFCIKKIHSVNNNPMKTEYSCLGFWTYFFSFFFNYMFPSFNLIETLVMASLSVLTTYCHLRIWINILICVCWNIVYCSAKRAVILTGRKPCHHFKTFLYNECTEVPTNYPKNFPFNNLHTFQLMVMK